MNKEIKFRVWGTISKMYHPTPANFLRNHFNDDGSINEDEYFAVEQYTGLKDKNGVEIYEGDVIHCATAEFLGADLAGVVEWSVPSAKFFVHLYDDTIEGMDGIDLDFALVNDGIVVGNIHTGLNHQIKGSLEIPYKEAD